MEDDFVKLLSEYSRLIEWYSVSLICNISKKEEVYSRERICITLPIIIFCSRSTEEIIFNNARRVYRY